MLELARPEDRAAINRICQQVHRLHVAWRPDLYCMDEALYDEAWFLEAVQEKQIYAARLYGATVGYVRFRIQKLGGTGAVPRKVFFLEDIAVEESCRGQGIGTQMMWTVLLWQEHFAAAIFS